MPRAHRAVVRRLDKEFHRPLDDSEIAPAFKVPSLSFVYSAYGLVLASEFPLRGPRGTISAEADVAIAQGPVPEKLARIETETMHWQANGNELLFDVPRVARYHVSGGKNIRYQPAAGTTADAFEPFLLGTCLGAALIQRGRPVLHAAVVAKNGLSVAICGKSGAGKSTASAMLAAAGASIVSDDLAALESTDPPIVSPGFPQSKLTAEAMAKAGLSAAEARWLGDRKGKYAVPSDGAEVDRPHPLSAIVVLERSDDGDLHVERQSGAEAIRLLVKHSYRRHFVVASLANAHLKSLGELVSHVPVWRIVRPLDRDSTESVASSIARLQSDQRPAYMGPAA